MWSSFIKWSVYDSAENYPAKENYIVSDKELGNSA